ncbi:hypothetical protein [Rhizobium sp. 1399]|uniref:hypothetical protein n=1 Tax=Rhizobium sp. 1399 TaxID=2817758 RepID=UPI00285C5C97|nr:hypothetical protein [Rhizobium sp. 1399]MDR6671326.1 hypothetical protein [Rhizobium sp. 1399]
MLAPVGQGETRMVPPSIASLFGVPETQVGTVNAGQGDTVVTPDGRTILGQPKPLSETEWRAQQNERLRGNGALTDSMLLDTIVGDKAPVQAIGPDGKTPVYMAPGQAARTGADTTRLQMTRQLMRSACADRLTLPRHKSSHQVARLQRDAKLSYSANNSHFNLAPVSVQTSYRG